MAYLQFTYMVKTASQMAHQSVVRLIPCAELQLTIWNSNGSQEFDLPGAGNVKDYFYAYDNLPYYVNGVNQPNNQGFFGHKVLAVSYGGTLILDGVKGSSTGNLAPSDSGTSWARLNATINGTNSTNNT